MTEETHLPENQNKTNGSTNDQIAPSNAHPNCMVTVYGVEKGDIKYLYPTAKEFDLKYQQKLVGGFIQYITYKPGMGNFTIIVNEDGRYMCKENANCDLIMKIVGTDIKPKLMGPIVIVKTSFIDLADAAMDADY
jgi:hypothetical protein